MTIGDGYSMEKMTGNPNEGIQQIKNLKKMKKTKKWQKKKKYETLKMYSFQAKFRIAKEIIITNCRRMSEIVAMWST